jgi:hypothetical protein
LDQNFLTTEEAKKTSDDELLNKLSAKPIGVISSEAEKWLQEFGPKERGV